MSRPSQPCIKGQPNLMGGINPMDKLPAQLNWLGCQDVPIGMSEQHHGALWDIDDNPSYSQPPL